jgi:uncharacterized membrane protein
MSSRLPSSPCGLAPLAGLILASLLSAVGCGAGDGPLAEVDPQAVPPHPTYEQVFSILDRACAPCHKDGGTEPRYDTCKSIQQNSRGLRSTVFGSNTMPPGAWPRLTSEEKLTVERWLDQGRVSPCN